MSEVSRTSRSLRNLGASLSTQAVLLVLAFVSRSVFVAYLGVEILGVNTLFMSVLAVLGLADLGVNTAVMYALYKPLADRDTLAIAGLVRLCGDLYRWVALAVLVIGLLVMLFLERLVDSDLPAGELYVGYLLLLATTVAGYLMAHRAVLLIADQRLYLTSLYSFLFTAARHVLQIVAMVTTESWLLFLVLHLLLTVLNNAFVFWRVGRLYPFVRSVRSRLTGVDRGHVMTNVRAMMAYRVGGVLLNNTDPVIIALLVGTTALGYYSNYLLVVGSALTFTELAFHSVSASVGNLSASASAERKRQVFDEIGLLAFWIYGSLAVAFWLTLHDVVSLWLGPEFVLGPVVLLAVGLNFYVYGITSPVMSYRTATGIFRETRYVMLVTAGLNLALSLVLGTAFGLPGILLATAIARLLTSFWYEPWKLCHRHLGFSSRDYFLRQALFALLLAVAYLASWAVRSQLPDASLVAVVVTAGASVASVTVVLLAAFGRTTELRALVSRLRALAGRPL